MLTDSRSDWGPLFAQASWVRRLAARLATDEHAADDLAQETWLAALRASNRTVLSPRRFLAGVVRNLARHERRGQLRRREKESSSDPAGLAPSAEEAFEKAELGRELALFVLELEEPFRSVVLLRFWEDLPLHAVAERLGIPLKTAESRLARGLARLRERWRRRHGDDASAAHAILLLARAPQAAPPAPLGAPASAVSPALVNLSLGAVIVNAKLVLTGLAVVCGGGLLWLWSSRGEAAAPGAALPQSSPTPVAASVAAPETARMAPSAEPEARTAIESAVEAAQPTEEPTVAEPTRTLVGRVLDPEARPLAGIAVVFARSDGFQPDASTAPSAVSGAAGAFELVVPRVDGAIHATDPALTTLAAANVRASSEVALLLVVAPHRRLAGTVVDARGNPIAHARVQLEPPADFSTRFDAVLDAARFRSFGAMADEAGRFELAEAPLVQGSKLSAAREDFVAGSLDAPQREALDLVLSLERAGGERLVAGRVVDLARRPVAGAWVSLGARTAQTDGDGEFTLDRSDLPKASELVALARGHRPARFRADLDPASGEPLFPSWVELVVGSEPLALEGTVVDENGKPRPGVMAWIADPTPFGVFEVDTGANVEFLLASETAWRGDFSEVSWLSTNADELGHFRIEGLFERGYTLRFMDAATLQAMSAGPFEAGRSDLRVVFEHGKARKLAGRIVTKAKVPLAKVRVDLYGAAFGGVSLSGGACTTDEDGRFAFDGIVGSELMLWLRGDDVIPRTYAVQASDADAMEIVLSARCHLKVDLSREPELADHAIVLDAEGERLNVYEIDPYGVTEHHDIQLVAGRSKTLGVSDTAATLVLEKAEVEVRRVPLVLVPGKINVVD